MALPNIGFSIGDVNGIGLEVILKSLIRSNYSKYFIPVIFGSGKVVSFHRNSITKDDINLNIISPESNYRSDKINVVNCWEEQVEIQLGEVTETGGKFALKSLEVAVEALRSGKIDALVTGPINKKAMDLTGFGFPGHTEFLSQCFGDSEPLMLMVQDQLRIGVVTGHIPLSDVAQYITKEAIIRKTQIFHKTLKVDFGIERPVIAVLGLNPHAGDQGIFGAEEEQVIRPAIIEMKKSGMMVMGPYPADGFFGSGNFAKFDGILAMYHDQGLVPFKTLAFGGGVNYTAGLPVIRTSPDHGTAFDIAGKNQASDSSIRQATYLALDIFRQRSEHMNLVANRLIVGRVSNDQEDEIIVDED